MTKVCVLPLPVTSTESHGGSDRGSTRQGGRSALPLFVAVTVPESLAGRVSRRAERHEIGVGHDDGRHGEIGLLREPQEGHVVGADRDGEAPGVRPARLVLPEVADVELVGGLEAELFPGDLPLRPVPALVEHEHGQAAVEERLAGPEADVAVVPDDPALDAQRVLVDGDGLEVGQDADRRRAHAAEVVPGDEWGGHVTPEAEQAAVLGLGQSGHADDHHVRVVPAPGRRELGQLLVGEGDAQGPGPVGFARAADVGRRPPQMTDGACPGPGIAVAPGAKAVDDGSSGSALGLAEDRVRVDDVLALAVAPVDLDVVGPPLGERAHVLELVSFRPGHGPAAGLRPGVRVERVFEALAMDMIAEPAQARWIALQVRREPAVLAAREANALVGADVGVARVLHAARDERAGDLPDERLVLRLLAEHVPGIPAHGRRQGQAVDLGVGVLQRALPSPTVSNGILRARGS